MTETFSVKGEVELFPQDKGWHYISVPTEISEPLEQLADRGLIAISATIGEFTWDTSLLPKGDGTHFIALPAKVRDKESLRLGDSIEVRFKLRSR